MKLSSVEGSAVLREFDSTERTRCCQAYSRRAFVHIPEEQAASLCHAISRNVSYTCTVISMEFVV